MARYRFHSSIIDFVVMTLAVSSRGSLTNDKEAGATKVGQIRAPFIHQRPAYFRVVMLQPSDVHPL